MSDTIDERDASAGSDAVTREDELARQEAIKRIEHKRRYWIGTAAVHRRHADSRGHLGHHRVSQRGRLANPGIQPEFRDP